MLVAGCLGAYGYFKSGSSPEAKALRVELKEIKATQEATRAKLRGLRELAYYEVASGLANAESSIAEMAITRLVGQGQSVLPRMRKLASGSSDPLVRKRAKTVIGRVTGNWGASSDLIWKRSLGAAVNREKPILLLQLFGKMDEEFC